MRIAVMSDIHGFNLALDAVLADIAAGDPFDEVVVAVFLAGYSNKTLPVKIWESIRLEFTPVIAVAATMMIVLAIVLFLVAQLVSSRREISTK